MNTARQQPATLADASGGVNKTLSAATPWRTVTEAAARARTSIMSAHERRSEPAPPAAPSDEPVIGPCIGCAPCDIREYLACPACLADRDKTLVAAGRLETLRWWFERYARRHGTTATTH